MDADMMGDQEPLPENDTSVNKLASEKTLHVSARQSASAAPGGRRQGVTIALNRFLSSPSVALIWGAHGLLSLGIGLLFFSEFGAALGPIRVILGVCPPDCWGGCLALVSWLVSRRPALAPSIIRVRNRSGRRYCGLAGWWAVAPGDHVGRWIVLDCRRTARTHRLVSAPWSSNPVALDIRRHPVCWDRLLHVSHAADAHSYAVRMRLGHRAWHYPSPALALAHSARWAFGISRATSISAAPDTAHRRASRAADGTRPGLWTCTRHLRFREYPPGITQCVLSGSNASSAGSAWQHRAHRATCDPRRHRAWLAHPLSLAGSARAHDGLLRRGLCACLSGQWSPCGSLGARNRRAGAHLRPLASGR